MLTFSFHVLELKCKILKDLNYSESPSSSAPVYSWLPLFLAFGPSSGLVTVFLVGARLILKTPPVI